jgi:hypothetical protein
MVAEAGVMVAGKTRWGASAIPRPMIYDAHNRLPIPDKTTAPHGPGHGRLLP